MSLKFTATADYGLSGQYVARLRGRHSKFTFEREFLGRKSGKRNEFTQVEIDEPGLYEECDVGKRGKSSTYYAMVPGRTEGGFFAQPIPSASAMALAKLLDAGHAWSELARVHETDDAVVLTLTPAAAKRAAAAHTLESAIETCWAALQALPEKEAKKVLSALKLRVSPPKAAIAEPHRIGVIDGEELYTLESAAALDARGISYWTSTEGLHVARGGQRGGQ